MSEQQKVATRTADPMSGVLRQQPQQTANLPALVGGSFNADAFHAMQERDSALIADQILHGYSGKEYVYKFSIQGTTVTGVSVVGARELAAHYGGIKARIVASVDKTDSLFVFKSFDPMDVKVQMIPQLACAPDFYEVVMEVTDLKTGNSIQVRKKETKKERKRDGTFYDRPHYDVIAESKAYRNGVLSIIPQNVIKQFEERALQAGNAGQEKTMDQLRDGALAFAAKNAIALDRHALEDLTYAQIMGLGNAAKDIAQFKEAAIALGLIQPATRIEEKGDPQADTNARIAAEKAREAAAQAASDAAAAAKKDAEKPDTAAGGFVQDPAPPAADSTPAMGRRSRRGGGGVDFGNE